MLDALTHGTLDVQGLPRINVPAEFRAAVVALVVNPVNVCVACRWLEAGVPAESHITGTVEQVTAEKLLALVLEVRASSSTGRYRTAFSHRTNLALDEEAEPLS